MLLVLSGCKRSVRDPSPSELVTVPPSVSVDEVRVEPGVWREAGGLTLLVPQGWSGTTGSSDTTRLLSVSHAATGVGLEISAFPEGMLVPRPRPDCTWVYQDTGRYRSVPALGTPQTAACVPESPTGDMRRAYLADVDGRAVHVEVSFPHGSAFVGGRTAEPLLRGLAFIAP